MQRAKRSQVAATADYGHSIRHSCFVTGTITLQSKWSKAFGVSFLQITHAKASLSLDLKTMQPTALEAQGAICIGSLSVCDSTSGKQSADNFIFAAGFVGVSVPADKKKNYFMVQC